MIARTYASEFPVQEIYFFRGFVERGRGAINNAIGFYERSMAFGRRDLSVRRELAWCYVQVNKMADAQKILEPISSSTNPFVVDLQILIAFRNRSFEDARIFLQTAAEVDSTARYNLRLSQYQVFTGNYRAAYDTVRVIDAPTGLRRVVLAQRIFCAVIASKPAEATKDLRQFEKLFEDQKDLINLLRALALVAMDDKASAISLISAFRQPSFYSSLLRRMMLGLPEFTLDSDAITKIQDSLVQPPPKVESD